MMPCSQELVSEKLKNQQIDIELERLVDEPETKDSSQGEQQEALDTKYVFNVKYQRKYSHFIDYTA